MNNLLITTVPVSFEDSERDDAYDRIDHFLRNNLDDGNYSVYSDFLEKVYGNSSAELEKQLAASQAYAEQLREALEPFCEFNSSDAQIEVFLYTADIKKARQALALPRDTSALDAYVAEKVKAARSIDEKQIAYLFEERLTLTRQRDLAVEAAQDAATSLETIHLRSYGEESYLDSRSLMRSYAGSRAKVARDAISAIKESEGSDGAVTRNA